MNEVEVNMVAVERLRQYSCEPSEAPWEIEDKKPSSSWPNRGELELQQYQTRYRPGLDLVLKGLTCHVTPGEKVNKVSYILFICIYIPLREYAILKMHKSH